MGDDEDKSLPASTEDPGTEIVVRNVRDLEHMSDAEMLGEDYAEWLRKRKAAARTTATKGYDVRLRAESAMAEAEEQLKKAEDKLGQS